MIIKTNTFDIGFRKSSLSYAFVQVSCTLKMDLKFSGPQMLIKTNTFDIDLKIFRFPGCGPERKKWTPPMQKCTFRLGHPFGFYKIKRGYRKT